MNKVCLTGRLADSPEVRYTASGKAVCTFALAIQGRGEQAAVFIDIVVWEKLAETCGNYLTKGRRVGIEGRLSVRKYETTEGHKRKIVEVVASEVEFLDSPKQRSSSSSEPDPFAEFGEDIPFVTVD